MKIYLQLLRVKDWAKNLFLFIPVFFAGQLLQLPHFIDLSLGFLSFSFTASSIYIINDYKDRDDDRKHPLKKLRPIASGYIHHNIALLISVLLVTLGLCIAWYIRDKFFFVLALYYLLNIAYSFGLKKIPILDIFIVAAGFNLRLKAGSVITYIPLSEWIVIMVFLLSLFMVIGKRRDDILLNQSLGTELRKSISGYSLDFLNILIALVCAVIIVAYFMYTMSPEVIERLGTYRLYYTSLFVLAGLFRYLQIIYVKSDSGSPTNILYSDRFIQTTLILWIISFTLIIYFKDLNFFK